MILHGYSTGFSSPHLMQGPNVALLGLGLEIPHHPPLVWDYAGEHAMMPFKYVISGVTLIGLCVYKRKIGMILSIGASFNTKQCPIFDWAEIHA